MLRVHTFGGCYVERDGMRLDALSGQRKALALLAVLAAAGGRGVSRDTMLSYLWPESDDERGRTSLKQLIHSLRTQLHAPDLLAASAELRLNSEVIGSDVGDFRAAVGRSDHAAAASLYAGPFLDGFFLRGADEFERWAASERGALAVEAARSLEACATEADSRGDRAAALEWWRRLVRVDPLSARVAVGLMRALDAAGDRAAALQHARVYQRLVAEELGGAADPSVAAFADRLQGAPPSSSSPPWSPPSSPVGGTAPMGDPVPLMRTDGNAPGTLADTLLPRLARGSRQPTPAPGPGRRAIAATALLALALAAFGAVSAMRSRDRAGPTPPASVAVMPFTNTSGLATDEHFSDGLADELITALGKVPDLKVTGRSSAFSLKGRNLGARAIADTLGVSTVLEGSVRREGTHLRITAQLVSASDGAVLWAERYDRDVRSVFAVQEEIARAIVGALHPRLAAGSPLVAATTADPEAYELYLRGRFIFHNQLGPDGQRQALDYFEQAIARDASYARAYAGVSDVHTRLAVFGYVAPREHIAKARAAAQRALALDSSLADAHASLAHILFVHDFDRAAAERQFRRAIELDPGYTFTRLSFAICLQDQGRFAEAIAQLDSARLVDPLSGAVPNVLGRVYVNARRPDSAIAALKGALELNPQLDLAHQQLGHAYLLKGMRDEAISALRRAAAMSGVRDSAQLAYAYAVTGNRAEAQKVLRELLEQEGRRHLPSFHVAMAYAGLRDVDAAFRWLERGLRERGSFMDGVKVTAAFEPLHGDPRWTSLLRRMNF